MIHIDQPREIPKSHSAPSLRASPGLLACAFFAAIIFSNTSAKAASLFGDFSCKDWSDLAHDRKKTWANAFLAPLSLTIQGLKRAEQDPYNDDPDAAESAISSINKFCLSYPQKDASDGATTYLNKLTGH